jgi:hypothetical protein
MKYLQHMTECTIYGAWLCIQCRTVILELVLRISNIRDKGTANATIFSVNNSQGNSITSLHRECTNTAFAVLTAVAINKGKGKAIPVAGHEGP